MVVLSPSPAVSHISSWLSTLYRDPPRSVEKTKKKKENVFLPVSQPVAHGAGGQQQLILQATGQQHPQGPCTRKEKRLAVAG